MGGRGASASEKTVLAVKENPSLKREIGKARYAVQFAQDGGIRTIDFNDTSRTDNEQRSLHSIDAYQNMKIYQRNESSNIYLFTESQMQKANKEMPTRDEFQRNREETTKKMENIAKKYANKIINKRGNKTTRRKNKNELPF